MSDWNRHQIKLKGLRHYCRGPFLLIKFYSSNPSNPENAFDLATVRRCGYKKTEREAFGIKIKNELSIL